MYADIIIDITHEKLDRIFQYSIPAELAGVLKVGMKAVVPFGRGNKETKGYIIGFSEQCGYDPDKIKAVLAVDREDVVIESRLVELAAWMKEHYGGTMIQALKTVLPIKRTERHKEKRQIQLLLDEAEGKEKLDYYLAKNQRARARLLAALLDDPVLKYEVVIGKLNITAPVIRALKEQGVIAVQTEAVYRNPVKTREQIHMELDYSPEQQHAIAAFREDYQKGIHKTYLVHGITGSGKTEVYIEAISQVVAAGGQAIVLIPEIALTYQTVMRFYRRFGDRVSIMNSRLSAGERYDQMMRARNGDIDIMIGPRSALFTPFANLGLIVIDEEHESTYKSEQTPRYHAREVAIVRAEIEQASVILGSATPSLEAFYKAERGEYQLLELKNRAMMQELPQVEVIDLCNELKNGNRSILSDRLRELMGDRLKKQEQMMLFLNRRGYAGFISCRSCGYVVKCPHCDVSLSVHRGGKLICHYCGYEQPLMKNCPSCGSVHIGEFKAGTQQVEEMVRQDFPGARVLRMDMDSTKGKDAHEKILAAFANEEADILIGTQMIVKGHDFKNVTLVGILAADMSLYANDYRAGERTFQLLTQAAGRAGRGEKKGEVVIQTYSPEHYSIVTAARQDYEAFYQEEMNYRDLMGYPPAQQLLAVLMSAADEKLLEQAAHYLAEYLKLLVKNNKTEAVQIIGPASPYIGKINDVYRKTIYVKQASSEVLIELKNKLEEYIEINHGFDKVRIQFDFNPMNVF